MCLGTLPATFPALGYIGSGQFWIESHVETVRAAVWAPFRGIALITDYGAAECCEDARGGVEHKHRILASRPVRVREPTCQFPCRLRGGLQVAANALRACAARDGVRDQLGP